MWGVSVTMGGCEEGATSEGVLKRGRILKRRRIGDTSVKLSSPLRCFMVSLIRPRFYPDTQNVNNLGSSFNQQMFNELLL